MVPVRYGKKRRSTKRELRSKIATSGMLVSGIRRATAVEGRRLAVS